MREDRGGAKCAARENQEAQPKRTEATGIRDFQAIVADTITNEYPRLRGIHATTSLATSNNSKIIIIGGKDGLPVILNTADAPAGTTTETAPTGATSSETDTRSAPPSNNVPPPASTAPSPSLPYKAPTTFGSAITESLRKPVQKDAEAPQKEPGPGPVRD
ncbi:MAG: hypothetical protein HYS20_08080 [Rhodocyclales bacterium]|nr:hypothetical protein [Rhodocyclales bacterium]